MLASIEKKGWEIDCAHRLFDDRPDLFGFWEDEKRKTLRPGDWAKLKLNFYHDKSTVSAYIWVRVESRTQKHYRGKIKSGKSVARYLNLKKLGEEISFTSEHVLQVLAQEEVH